MQDGQPEPGDIIAGKYVVEHVLGRGGMGTVFAVSHRETGKRLAIKCLLPAYINNASVVERFLRESKAVGRIQHRQVIDVFDQGRDGSVLYMVLPLLDGKPLSELMHDATLTLDEALVILVRAMQGVAAANALGVLHRDLKPSNIFVCYGVTGRLDDPRVLDFGISKLDDEEQPLTHSGVAVGTPYYMPLEQLTGKRDLDARVDVYAMGVILYEAMSGSVPHLAENVAALALRLMHTPPVHLSTRRPDLPPGLAAVVMRALARDREDRYASMQALIDAIVPFISQGAGLTVRPPEGALLRTPRDTAEPGAAHEMAAAAATTKPAKSAAGSLDEAAPLVSARGSIDPPRRASRVGALLLLGAFVVGGVLALGRPAAEETPLARVSKKVSAAVDASVRSEPRALELRAAQVQHESVALLAADAGAVLPALVPAAGALRPKSTASRAPTVRPKRTTQALPSAPAAAPAAIKAEAVEDSRAGKMSDQEF